MNLDELKNKIADILGVSNSQRELSFDIFVEKLVQGLVDGITIKVPGVGFFQFKEQTKKINATIVFTPPVESLKRETKNLYLTIDVSKRNKNSTEFDSQVFSLGIGKPLIPLSIEEETSDLETSYAMLRKSIEERAQEVIIESDQIPNYNIWNDFYDSPNKTENEQNISQQLDNLTADIKFDSLRNSDLIEDDKFDIKRSLMDSPDGNEFAKQLNDLLIQSKIKLFGENAGKKEEPDTPEHENKFNYKSNDTNIELVKSNDEEPNNFEFDETELLKLDLPDTTITLEQMLEEELNEKKPQDLNESSTQDHVNSSNTKDVFIIDSSFEKIIEKFDERVGDDNSKIIKEDSKENDSDDYSTDTLNEKVNFDIGLPNLPEDDNKDDEVEITLPEYASKIIEEELITHQFINENAFEDVGKNTSEAELNIDEEIIWEDVVDEQNDKIDWNWGDELKEEFGVIPFGDDGVLNSSDSITNEDDLNLVDEIVEELPDQDIGTFDKLHEEQLEKKLKEELENELIEAKKQQEIERRITQEIAAERRKTRTHYEERREEFESTESEMRSTKTSNLRAVIEAKREFDQETSYKSSNTLFSSKYEFIEEKPASRKSKIAIGLSKEFTDEQPRSYFTNEVVPIQKPAENSKFYKTLIIILSVALVVAISLTTYILLKNSGTTSTAQNEVENTDGVDNFASGTPANPYSSESFIDDPTAIIPGEVSDFPRVASIDEGNNQTKLAQKNEVVIPTQKPAVNKPQKNEVLPANKTNIKVVPPVQNNSNVIVSSSGTETRISNSLYFDGKNYFAQISSWRNRIKADQEIIQLRDSGTNAYIQEVNLPEKGGIWYRVRVGPFKTQREAEVFLTNFN
jgi:cell division septation protein DedD